MQDEAAVDRAVTLSHNIYLWFLSFKRNVVNYLPSSLLLSITALSLCLAPHRFCSPSDLGSISLYLGRYLQVPVSQDVCNSLLRVTMREPARMKGDDIAAVTYLLATSGFKGREREVDDLVYTLKQKLGECSLSGLEMIYNALPSLGTGYRLNETVTEAATKWEGRGGTGKEDGLLWDRII